MKRAPVKNNPGIHGDQELIDSFVVRHDSQELILEILRANTGDSNQHVLVVGPRGIGRTMLVRRVAAEVRNDSALSAAWYPVVCSEESYMVASAGEFWLEALFHLGEQTKNHRWIDGYQELLGERDEVRLRQRALAQLMDFADDRKRRILLIVENLNMLLGQQISGAAAWELRHTLLNEPRLMLLGSATSRFEEIKNVGQAWFELFAIHDLEPLEAEECKTLWTAVTGSEWSIQRLRPIQILTGGNPRLLRIFAEFADDRPFRELMTHLVQLIDDHTEYFRSRLENLAPTERKVFVTLLDLWDPVDARTVARAARLGVNKVSVLLNRLAARGAVQVLDQQGHRKIYQASERFFNIYYLMRRRGRPAHRIRAMVAFMVGFYDESEDTAMTSKEAINESTDGTVLGVLNNLNEFPANKATNFLIARAAAGRAEDALNELQRSQAAATFEPLVAGLQIFLGQMPLKAREILEVGRDVAERIRQRQVKYFQ